MRPARGRAPVGAAPSAEPGVRVTPALLALLLWGAVVACGGPDRPPAAPPAPSGATAPHRPMPQRLQELIRALEPAKNRFANTARAAYLKAAIPRSTSRAQRIALTTNLADELLKAGRIEEAMRLTRPFLQEGRPPDPDLPPPDETRRFLATCELRLGEQQNCIAGHNLDSCLLPIRGGGVYRDREGPRAAIVQLTRLLQAHPGDLESRWLLNLAYMTLGDYPQRVPPAWLIPPRVFAAEYDVGRFPDAAPTAGLDFTAHAGGAIMEDFDGDGLLDILVSSMGVGDQMRLYHNDGDGTFSDRTAVAGLIGEVGGLNMVQADYDNDGHPDVLVLRGGWMHTAGAFPNSLLRNRGDGSFEDVTEAAGILSFHPTQTAAWGDYDGDGRLDLFIGNESGPEERHPCELYHNNGDGTFTDRSAVLGEGILGYVKGVAWGDIDNDGRPDLYVSVMDGDNRLYHNDGPRRPPGPHGEDWGFTDVSRAAGTLQPRDGFATWFWDYDNDGWLDLFVAGYRITDMGDVAALYLGRPTRTALPRLYHNQHDGTFRDVTAAMHMNRLALTMACNYGDLDNDGWPDAYFGNGEPSLRGLLPNVLLRNAGGRVFQDVTTSANVGHLQKGHGVAFGDIDNDGDQDIFEEMGGWYESDVSHCVLYRNPGHAGRFLTLRLEGRRANRAAIGGRIRVRVSDAAGRERDIYALVGAGGSFGGNSLQQEIGLGRAAAIDVVEIRWPAPGTTQIFRGLQPDRVYRLVEGESSPQPIETRRVPLR
jgi:FG-GAP-like repeat/ASPIC and UnbV